MGKYVAVAVETTYGTAVTSPTEYFEVVSESLELQKELLQVKTVRSPAVRSVALASQAVRGSVVAPANYQENMLLFKHFFGSVDSTSSGTGGLYSHTFPASTGIPSTERDGLSLTVHVSRDTYLSYYAGAKVTGFHLSAAVGSLAQITWDFIASGESTATTETSASYAALNVMLPTEITVKFDGTSVNCKSVQLDAVYPVDEPIVLGSTTFALEPKSSDTLAVTGTFTNIFQDLTQHAKVISNADVDLQLIITDATNTWTINIDKSKLSGSPHLNERARTEETINFLGYYNSDASPGLQLVALNGDTAIP